MENRGSKGWLGEVPGASTDSDLVRLGATLRKILSRVPRGRPHYAKKASYLTPKAQSQVQCWMLCHALGQMARRIPFEGRAHPGTQNDHEVLMLS